MGEEYRIITYPLPNYCYYIDANYEKDEIIILSNNRHMTILNNDGGYWSTLFVRHLPFENHHVWTSWCIITRTYAACQSTMTGPIITV